MKKFLLLFILITSLAKLSFAQTNQMDSLVQRLDSEKTDTGRIDLYLKLGELCDVKDNLKYAEPALKLTDNLLTYIKDDKQRKSLLWKRARLFNFCTYYYQQNGDSSNQKKYLFKELETFKLLKDTNETFSKYLNIASYYFDHANTPTSIEYYKKAIAFAKENNNKRLVSYGHFQMGVMFLKTTDYKNAKAYFEKANKTSKELKDTTALAWGTRQVGVCYSGLYDTISAMKYFNEALRLYQNDQRGIIATLQEIGDAYKFNKNYANAIVYYRKCLSLAERINFPQAYFKTLNRLGNTYRDAGNYDSALVYINKAYQIALQAKQPEGIFWSEYSLAKIYYAKRNYPAAKKYFDKVYNVAQTKIDRYYSVDVEQSAYKLDSALGNYKQSLQHHINYINLRDKFNNEDLSKQATKEKYQEQFEKQKAGQEAKNAIAAAESKKQKLLLILGSCVLLLLAAFAGVIFRSLRINQKNNKLISEQKHLVEEKQKEILDSITYAKRLQEAILPPKDFISRHLPENFVLYKPKDIVAGDFYWAETTGDLFFIAAADSTGHGVPGAMVSVVCSNALNRTVKEFNLTDTGKILDKTRELVIETFKKSAGEVKDGMDISLLCINLKSKKVFWSGANNPLWYIQNSELKEIKADKQPVGKTENPGPYTTHEIEYKENTTFYLFTDGLPDQFGGPRGKKFKYKQLEELLVSINGKTMQEQSGSINQTFENWRGTLEQVDDICVIGIRV